MTRIYTEMVADLFHPGHVNFLRIARARCEHLTVGLLRDEAVRVGKGSQRPVMSFEERRTMLEACRYVDRVIEAVDCPTGPTGRTIRSADLDAIGCDTYVFAAANDAERAVKLEFCRELPRERLIVLPYTPGVSTSALIERILGERGS